MDPGTGASVSAAYGTLVHLVSVSTWRAGVTWPGESTPRLGDILLETSGMPATTELAPRAFVSRTTALWPLPLALAHGIQAQIVKLYGEVSDPAHFGVNGAIAVAAGVAVIAAAPWLERTMHPVR
ncbi:dipeptide/tripeptide permease [Streptomyces sp. B1I3]|nr:dipeptide/tripeptide permease [Streptomyces sp. B1I3]